MKPFEYAIADNSSGVTEAIKRGYAIKASGIDVLDLLKERITKSDKYVSIEKIDGLRGIERDGGGVEIGPLTTLREIAESELLADAFPALAHAAAEAATPQIRARATAGGNLLQRPRCWYYRSNEYNCLKKGGDRCYAVDGDNTYHAIFGDGPCHIIHSSSLAPSLVAADAELEIEHRGESKTVKLGSFFEMPDRNIYNENSLRLGALVTAIRVPRLPKKSAWIEFREKASFDWPLAACAVAHTGGSWRVVLGMVAPIPWRSEAAEAILSGIDSITPEIAEQAADAAVADASPMSMNGYRVKLARAAVRRALLHADGKEFV